MAKTNGHLRLGTGPAELKAATIGWGNIRIIDEIYQKEEADATLSARDAFVSLRRARVRAVSGGGDVAGGKLSLF
ncbi:MAG: hypothetical protein LBG43_06240 [Treponema sp.]|nr:hypothetical protein [Treponema sp.]